MEFWDPMGQKFGSMETDAHAQHDAIQTKPHRVLSQVRHIVDAIRIE